jgi:hypothetical protein
MYNLYSCLEEKLDQDQVDRLARLMQQSVQIEQLFGQMQQLNDSDRKENINLLKSNAGSFTAMSQIVLL